MAKRTGTHQIIDESVGSRAKLNVDEARRKAILRAVVDSARGKAMPGPDAAHSQDFLYDDDGLPG